jgi:NAD(P)H dehydrogenase (quinone)
MNIAVTAATGHLGQLVIKALLDRGIAPSDLIAIVRNPDKAAPLAAQAVTVRQADYGQSAALAAALAGVDRVLLISGVDPNRAQQHRNVVEAVRGAGVGLLAYTSVVNATTSKLMLAADHKATEDIIRNSGVPFALLRNSWYIENYTGNLPQTLESGVIWGSAGEGKVSAATRADYAAAAAAVLSGEGHENRVYELGGEGFTVSELAGEISKQSGTEVVYHDLPVEEYTKVLVGAGLPEPYAVVLADADRAISEGELFTDSGDLSRLIGRSTTPLAQAVAVALGNLPQARAVR